MNTPEPARRRPPRRLVVAAALAAVVVVVVAAVVVLTASGDGATAGAAATTTAAPASVSLAPAPVTPEPTGPTSDATDAPASLAPVALDSTAAVGNGITAEVVDLESADVTAVGPGNVSGPALKVTVSITNGTAAAVSLDGVAVELSYGEDHTPGSLLDDSSATPFRGVVEPGSSAQGVYLFTVPEDDRDVITVSVGYQAGAPFLVFVGSAG